MNIEIAGSLLWWLTGSRWCTRWLARLASTLEIWPCGAEQLSAVEWVLCRRPRSVSYILFVIFHYCFIVSERFVGCRNGSFSWRSCRHGCRWRSQRRCHDPGLCFHIEHMLILPCVVKCTSTVVSHPPYFRLPTWEWVFPARKVSKRHLPRTTPSLDSTSYDDFCWLV